MKYLILSAMMTSSLISNSQTINQKKMITLVESKNAKLFTTVYPKENSETVILLHGGPGVPDDLTFAADLLAEHFQVITFHQRGTAKSPVSKSDFSIESYIADIDSIAAYFDLEKFHLFGHSWGGLYAQIYAQNRSEKILSLFLSSPSSGTGYQWKETENEVMKFNTSKLTRSEFISMGWNSFKGMLGSDKAYQKVFKQVLKNYNKGFEPSGDSSIDLTNVKAKAINKTRKELNKYPVLKVNPVTHFKITITYGDRDIYGVSKKYVRERYPSASVITMINCGHLPALQSREKFMELFHQHYLINISSLNLQ